MQLALYHQCMYLLAHHSMFILAVTFPSLEGIAQRILRRYTKAGPAMDSLSDAAVTIIKARQQEGSAITVRLY